MNDFSRRSFARLLGTGAAVAAFPSVLIAQRPAGPVLLNSNENSLGPSPAAVKAMRDVLTEMFRYPDDAQDELHEAIARHHGVSNDEILLGNGSSDILRLASGAFPGRVVTADPTFEILALHARMFGHETTRIPLTAGHGHDVEKMAEAAKGGALVYVCNPNNPTGTITPKAAVRWLIDTLPATMPVLVDEAYHHYADSADYESVAPLIKTRPNVIVARTFSKVHALAGARVGYAVASKEMIGRLRSQQMFNVMSLAGCVGARAALLDEAHTTAAKTHNRETRAWLAKELRDRGFTMLPSETNFVMIDLGRDVRPVITAFREQGVRIGRLFPARPQHVRVTIGTKAEMNRFVETFDALRAQSLLASPA